MTAPLALALVMVASSQPRHGDVQRARGILGLTQRALAERLDVAPETVCRWESGALEPSRVSVLAVAALLFQSEADSEYRAAFRAMCGAA